MRGIDLDGIIQIQKLLMQAVVHHFRHLLRCVTLRARQIGPAHVADEKRVTGQNLLRFVAYAGVRNQHADTFRSVARCFQNPQVHSPDHQFIVVARCLMRKLNSGVLAENDFRAGA